MHVVDTQPPPGVVYSRARHVERGASGGAGGGKGGAGGDGGSNATSTEMVTHTEVSYCTLAEYEVPPTTRWGECLVPTVPVSEQGLETL